MATPNTFLSRFFNKIASFASLKHYWAALVIFLTGCFITISIFHFYQQEDFNRLQGSYSRFADTRMLLIQEKLIDTVKDFAMTKQFFDIMGPQNITKKIFHEIIHHSLILYPNLLALAWKSNLPTDKNSDLGLNFLPFDFNDVRKNEFVDVDFLELGYIRPPFYFGLNDYSCFIKGMEKAKELGSLTISEEVRYFQDGEKFGFFIYDTILNNKEDLQEAKNIAGVLIGFSDLNMIIEYVNKNFDYIGINIGIYDRIEGVEKLLLWNGTPLAYLNLNASPEDATLIEEWTLSRLMKIGNRTWTIKASPDPGYFKRNQFTHWEILFTGFVISFLTAYYFLFLVNKRLLIEQEVHNRTNELAKTNQLLQEEVHSRQMIEMDIKKKQRYLVRRHEALGYLTKLTVSELKIALKEVILRTSDVMEIDRVSVWFYETTENNLALSCAGLYNHSTNTFTDQLEFISTYFPHYFQALSSQNDLIIPMTGNAEVNAELSSYLAAFHIESKLDISIIFEGKLLGVLSCEETRQNRRWDLEDRHFGHSVADIIAIMLEQTARRKAENALIISEERLRFITHKGADAIISISEDEKIFSWNEGAENMFGYTESEMLGKSLTTIIPEQTLQKDEITSKPIELVSKHKNNNFFPVELSQSRWKIGDINYDTIIIRDITERKENEKKLIKAIRDANAASQAKSEFLTIVSHELRTPLNAIIGYDQCLLIGMDGPISEEQKVSLKKIEKSSFHLLHLINDILDLAKIEANKMELEIQPQNIVDTIVSCVDEMQSLARQKDLKVVLSFSKPYILMEYDKTRIRQVLLNLLGNAVKFTEKGTITVSLLNYSSYVEIHVVDTGIGLSPDEIIKLFMAFSQADTSITRRYGGSGLGLAISKKIVDLHNGKIDVKSEKGLGSTFIITLPKIQ